jgi:hypothetical protein
MHDFYRLPSLYDGFSLGEIFYQDKNQYAACYDEYINNINKNQSDVLAKISKEGLKRKHRFPIGAVISVRPYNSYRPITLQVIEHLKISRYGEPSMEQYKLMYLEGPRKHRQFEVDLTQAHHVTHIKNNNELVSLLPTEM